MHIKGEQDVLASQRTLYSSTSSILIISSSLTEHLIKADEIYFVDRICEQNSYVIIYIIIHDAYLPYHIKTCMR